MKTFFILLLLTNIALAFVQWLFPYDQLFKKTTPLIAAEPLRLLDEPDSRATTRKNTKKTEKTPVLSATGEGKLCYTLGPFKETSLVQKVMSTFKQNDITLASRPSIEKEYMGLMVYIDDHKTREKAMSTAKALAEKGIGDYMIVTEENKTNALSLGVFGLKKNAERRMRQIADLGYKVKSEPRYRDQTIYWLDYDKEENETLTNTIDQLKSEHGVSRISRICS